MSRTVHTAADERDVLALSETRRLLDCALSYSARLREVIRSVVADGFAVDTKSDASPVTSADIEAERVFRECVALDFPEAGVIGEEFGVSRPDAALQWVIDPIDGTAEFVHHLPFYGSIIGLFLNGQPLLGAIDHPALDLRSYAAFGLGAHSHGEPVQIKDTSTLTGKERIGAPSRAGFLKIDDEGAVFEALSRAQPNLRVFHSCYAHTCVARGALDAAIEWDNPLWDIAATRILIEEAGGDFVQLRERAGPGGQALYSVVFGKPRVVAHICAVLAKHL